MAKKGAKIGEGHVSIHADMDDFNRGLDQLEKKTQETVKKTSRELTTGIGGAITAIVGMLATAKIAFQKGLGIGSFYRDVMDARILIQDLRSEMGKSGDELFGKAQSDKSSLLLKRLRQQVSVVGNVAGGAAKIVQEEYKVAARAIQEEGRDKANAAISDAEKKLSDYEGLISDASKMEGENGFLGGVLASMGPGAVIAYNYQKKIAEIEKARAGNLSAINKATEDRLKILKEEAEFLAGVVQDQENVDIFNNQNRQRGGFGLGQTALDPTVLSRELGRVYSNGGRY